MPCIQLTVSQKLSEEKKSAIKRRLGEAIEIIPGKTETWLMVVIHDDACVYYQGHGEESAAFVDVSIYGQDMPEAFDRMTKVLCTLLNEELGTSPQRIYVKYSSTRNWGWNGVNF